MTDVYDVIKPYEDDQLKISMHDNAIHRMPSLVSTDGSINPKFQKFYSSVVRAVLYEDLPSLFTLSEGDLSEKEFYRLYQVNIQDKLNCLLAHHGHIDIELNLRRFEEGTRNILGGLLINGWYISEHKCQELDTFRTTLIKLSGELLFTYSNDDFKLLQHVSGMTTSME